MQLYSITSPQEREALTLSLLEYVSPLMRQHTGVGKLDYEELYQDASIKIMYILDHHIDQVTYLRKYVSVSIKHLILDKIAYQQKRRAVSLDESLLDDAFLSLLDVVPSPYSVEPAAIVLAKERLEELRVMISAARWWQTRRMLSEMYDTAQATQAQC